jgi:hypothetical protein
VKPFSPTHTGEEQTDRMQRDVAGSIDSIIAAYRSGQIASGVAVTAADLRIMDQTFVVYTGKGGHTVTLPKAAALGMRRGRAIVISHLGPAGALTVAPQGGGETVNLTSAVRLYPGDCAVAVSDGDTKWTAVHNDVGRDWSSYRHAGGNSIEAWYYANVGNGTALTTGAPSADTIRALPFVAPARGGTMDRIAINVTANVGGTSARIAVYSNTADDNLYPSVLLADSGVLSTASNGVKSSAITVALQAGALYWLAHVGNGAPTLRCLAVGGVSPVLGTDNTLGTAPTAGLSVAYAFAAFPATFPSGAVAFAAVPIPALAYRMA